MDGTRAIARRRQRRPASGDDVQELLARYPGEWLAIDVKAKAEGRPKAGSLVYHAKDQDEVWQKTRKRKRLYIVFAGPPLKEGYVAAF